MMFSVYAIMDDPHIHIKKCDSECMCSIVEITNIGGDVLRMQFTNRESVNAFIGLLMIANGVSTNGE